MENNISTILVIPINLTICSYYINSGEKHVTTYDKLKNIIATISNVVSAQSNYYFDRLLPFFADIEKKQVFEIEKKVDINEYIHKTINFSDIKNYYSNNIDYSKKSQYANDIILNKVLDLKNK